ncbi:hypothetical protein [Leptospira jelokensis]|uniref:hypothetical protein n=1 Tax=Leptospira jelokensis TaxID=2484931 RepID=UPI0010912FBC|nr:hypothetical protein [Leptospira jelokensis]TGM06411.1 hypothetical protein EHQ79_00175 [Leptospira jelokensis]
MHRGQRLFSSSDSIKRDTKILLLDAVEREKKHIDREYAATKSSLENAIRHDKNYLEQGGKDFSRHYDAVIKGYSQLTDLKNQYDSDMLALNKIKQLTSNNKIIAVNDSILEYNTFSKSDRFLSEFVGIRRIETARMKHLANPRFFNTPINPAVGYVRSAIDKLKQTRAQNDKNQVCHTSFSASGQSYESCR